MGGPDKEGGGGALGHWRGSPWLVSPPGLPFSGPGDFITLFLKGHLYRVSCLPS